MFELVSVSKFFVSAQVRLPQIRKWPEKIKTLQGQGKAREVYFESGEIDTLKKRQGA